MFDQLIASGGMQIPTHKPLSLTLAVLFHGLLAGLLLIFPMLFPQSLVRQLDQFVNMVAPPPPPRAGAPEKGHQPAMPHKQESAPTREMVMPKIIPSSVVDLVELPPPESTGGTETGPLVPGGEIGGKGVGIPGGAPWSQTATPIPPQPEIVKPESQRLERLKVSEGVQAALLMVKQTPAYPPLARMSRIQGAVALSAVISPEGLIEELRVISGHPLLIPAALEAVRKWRYRPTLLNGEPVRVETTIVVNFLLHGS